MNERLNARIARWVDDAREGSPRAQHKLFKHYYGLMYSVCMRYADSTDEADDMLNEGFLKVFSNLNMYVMEGYSHAEIAQSLGITESTSAWHLNHARNRLKKEISKMYNE